MRFGGVRRNLGRIFGSACAATLCGAWGGALLAMTYILLMEGFPARDAGEILQTWALIGAFILIFVLPSVALVAIPGAFLIVGQDIDRTTGAIILFGLASLPIVLTPALLDAATGTGGGRIPFEFIALSAPFAYSAALAMYLVLYRRKPAHVSGASEAEITP